MCECRVLPEKTEAVSLERKLIRHTLPYEILPNIDVFFEMPRCHDSLPVWIWNVSRIQKTWSARFWRVYKLHEKRASSDVVGRNFLILMFLATISLLEMALSSTPHEFRITIFFFDTNRFRRHCCAWANYIFLRFNRLQNLMGKIQRCCTKKKTLGLSEISTLYKTQWYRLATSSPIQS